ncbi:hypothetical protein [Bifidobacterium callitrichidarum]|uniref:Uncharacterized protein n=1 Tax=Bifidobacterium callitrichidarum TaxID=2052941 RepID=A0A2U2N9H6_9BIFI|nr:hypothetical protein [Bifidobacterium callitrichidarum]PWG65644.1 hypothetical protein DF196_06845 [Bifidobacterium callitrichidarum]
MRRNQRNQDKSSADKTTGSGREPYRPKFDEEREIAIIPLDSGPLITNQGLVVDSPPCNPLKRGDSQQKLNNFERRMNLWYAQIGNQAREHMGDRCRYDAKHLTDVDYPEIMHLVFDPKWAYIANHKPRKLGVVVADLTAETQD